MRMVASTVVATLLALVVAVLVAVGTLAAPVLIELIAPGFTDESASSPSASSRSCSPVWGCSPSRPGA